MSLCPLTLVRVSVYCHEGHSQLFFEVPYPLVHPSVRSFIVREELEGKRMKHFALETRPFRFTARLTYQFFQSVLSKVLLSFVPVFLSQSLSVASSTVTSVGRTC